MEQPGEMASPEAQLKSVEGGGDKLMEIAHLKEDDLLEKSKEELRELSDEVRASKALAQKMAKLLTRRLQRRLESCSGECICSCWPVGGAAAT
jgi:hypothetical protein